MIMKTMNATKIRENFGGFIDDVVRVKPKMVKRSRDHVLAINPVHQRMLLEAYQFHAQFMTEEDGTITASLQEIDIVVNEETKEEAISALAHDLMEYAEEYYEDFELYATAPNRQSHFPFVMKVLIQEDFEGVKRLIHA